MSRIAFFFFFFFFFFGAIAGGEVSAQSQPELFSCSLPPR